MGAMSATGVDLIWKAPISESDKEQQIAIVEECIADGVSGIVLSPISHDGLSESVSKAMKKKIPVWAAIDVAQDVDHVTGIMHPDIFNRSAVYGPKFGRTADDLTRKAGVYSGFFTPRHAVLIYGADWPNGPEFPIKYLVENSWGFWYGDWGDYHMYRPWFLKYCFEIVVHKSALTPELKRILESEPEQIHQKWDW